MARSLGFLSVVGVGLLWANVALAEPSAADRATARALAGEGYQALQSKDYATAVDRFSRADAMVHAPTLMIDWARALVGLGKLVEAQERYEQILREGVDAKAPKSWQRALSDAGSELAEIKPRLAWVTISVTGCADARVTIDGVPVPPAAIGVRRAVNPGSRNIRVQAPRCLAQKRVVALHEGAEEALAFNLEQDPDAAIAAPVQDLPLAPPPPRVERDRTGMYVAFGVSGAGLLLGAVTGGLALNQRSQLSSVCLSSGACKSDQEDNIRAYHTWGALSGAGFAVGVASAGVGVTLWFLNRNAAAENRQGVALHPYLGVGSIGAVGSF